MRPVVLIALALGFVNGPSLVAIELRKDIVGSFGAAACSPDQFRGRLFDLEPETRYLPDLDKAKPNGREVCNYWLNVPPRSFLEGIPGVSSRIEWFAIDYQADFWVETPGSYMFTLLSDDGSKLFVDGKTIIDNDGVHPPKELGGRAKLEPGKHHIRVSYFQGPRETVALVLKVAPPKGAFDFFDLRNFRPPATQQAAAEAMADETRPILRRATEAHDPMAAKAYEVAAMAALTADPRPHDFELRAKVFRFRAQRVLTLEVPGAALKTTPVAGGKLRVHVVMLAVIKDAEGKVVDKVSEDFPVDLPADRLPSLQAATVRMTRPLTLPPGVFVVQAVAADREGDRASTSAFRVDSNDRPGLALSDLVLVRRIELVPARRVEQAPAQAPGASPADDPFQLENRRVIPELAPTIPTPGAESPVYFAVYPNAQNAVKPEMTIELSLEGKVVGRQSSPLPDPNDAGVIPMTIAVPVKSGKHRLRILIRQGTESVERTLDFAVQPPSN